MNTMPLTQEAYFIAKKIDTISPEKIVEGIVKI